MTEKEARAGLRLSLKKVRFPKFKGLRRAFRKRKFRIPKVSIKDIYDSEDLLEVAKELLQSPFMD